MTEGDIQYLLQVIGKQQVKIERQESNIQQQQFTIQQLRENLDRMAAIVASHDPPESASPTGEEKP